MTVLDGWTKGEHTASGVTHPTYRKGSGPGVVVISEIPGITEDVIAFAEEVVGQGLTVVMPHLFGKVPSSDSPLAAVGSLRQACVNREFNKLRLHQTSPIADWLRSLARDLHAELGGPGVGALGMCFTGGFALAMMVDDSVAAPVLAQPSLPFPVGKARAADLNLSPADLAKVKERAAAGCQVLGLRYTGRHGRRHPLRHPHPGARRRVPPRRVPRPQALHADRPPPAGGRRPGAGVLPGEAAHELRLPARSEIRSRDRRHVLNRPTGSARWSVRRCRR